TPRPKRSEVKSSQAQGREGVMRTPRPHARTRRAAAALLVASAGLLSLAGCDPRTLIYFLQPYDSSVAAPGPSLKGKKVVVVTHPPPGAPGAFQSLDRDIPREVTAILRENVKKVDMVEPKKVWTWVDDPPNGTAPAELAKAFEADVVVFLEVEGFQLQ